MIKQLAFLLLIWLWNIFVGADQLALEITPQCKGIYKVPQSLGYESWCIFITLINKTENAIAVEKLQFTTYSEDKQRTCISRNMVLSVKPKESVKLPMEFFWDHQEANVDRMRIEVFHSLEKSFCEIPLVRYQQKIKVSFPLLGVWKVGSAHEFGISHRRWDNRSHFGWDFLKFDAEGKTYSGDYRIPQNHYAFGQPVFAPADGIVLEIHDGETDHAVGVTCPTANSVFLDLGGGVICCMAHLRSGSILVQKGEQLKKGQKIAEVGNSGQSDLPHLHLHFQLYEENAPLKPGISIPISLNDYLAISPHGKWTTIKEGQSQKGDFIAAMIEIEKGVYKVPLILSGSLEPQREDLEEIIISAQRRILEFAKQYGWEELTKESFMQKVEIYAEKEEFDRNLLEVSGEPPTTQLPKEYSAALEKRVLIAVSPELYDQNYPEGIEEKSFEKLLTHEIAHRLHVRILKENEEAMGPIWFFEGFAIYAAGQFEKTSPELSPDEIWEIVRSAKRGSYKKYATIFRYFLQKTSLHELIKHAGEKDFIHWLQQIDRTK